MIVDVPGIPLRRRDGTVLYALVEPEDFVWLNTWRWGIGSSGYVQRYDRDRQTQLAMHRELMGLVKGDGLEVDHINGDRLDNRRANLRVATSAQNRQNLTVLRTDASSRFRGVYFHARSGSWCASAKLNGKTHHLGTFATETEAAMAAARFRREHMPFSIEERIA